MFGSVLEREKPAANELPVSGALKYSGRCAGGMGEYMPGFWRYTLSGGDMGEFADFILMPNPDSTDSENLERFSALMESDEVLGDP